MQVELSAAELRLVCVGLAFLRNSYQEDADACQARSAEGPAFVEMAADHGGSAASLQSLIDRLRPLLRP